MQLKDGFLHNVMLNINDSIGSKLEYRTEYYTLDSLYITGEDLGYPSELHALIEHENGEKVEEEMWKLSFWRSPLKIIIFYDYSGKEKENNETKVEWLENKLTKLKDMLKKINDFHSESSSTEYLFIIGAKNLNDEIYWRWASNISWGNPTKFIG